MKVVCIGGGPGGLFSGILLKKAFPDAEIEIFERNKPDDTFGWGVVFSDETFGNIEAADPVSIGEVRGRFRYWDDIHTFFGGECVVSTGHGFCGTSRRELLEILQARCRELGVRMNFEVEIDSLEQFADADLIIACDGVNSWIREAYREHFKPSIDWRKCKFAWYGTDLELEAFTFIFKENDAGLFQVHAYPFADGLSTWIVECREEVWKRAGLDEMSIEESLAYCQDLFSEDLRGHRLLDNNSIWRTFPTIRNERWYHDNIVLMGDAVHTAHFSIGSGTKLALEDAMALADAMKAHHADGIPAVLEAYQEARFVDTIKLQKAAQTSLEWFENSARYLVQDPVTFSFNLMTRSKRITYDNLRLRDPELVARTTRQFAKDAGVKVGADAEPPVPMFTPYRIGDMPLANRVVVSPMCQYSATDGIPDDWHLVHLGSRAIGGAGLVITEMTNVSPDGRITPGCAGMWSEAHADAWRRIVEFTHAHSQAKICVQLAHAGRKGSVSHPWQGDDVPLASGGWPTLAPSAIPFRPGWQTPKAMDRADMDRVRDEFVRATELAHSSGFDMIELHMAHGYLLSSFLSPLSNRRDDEYGGSLQNRMRYPLEVLDAVRAAWPADKPVAVRISASDWADDDGLTGDDAVVIARELRAHGCAVVDVSSGGNTAEHVPEYGRMYQVPFAERIKYEVGVPVIAVGAIQGADHCNTVLAAGRADLCALARPHLYDPYLTLHAAAEYGFEDVAWPGQYLLGRRPAPRRD
ncbi:MAG: bifunctional salicylyl-CoA 5-hydroxylase/oxidoreductase [Planctomycetes bacterium]|nr:bifunctional salicylyl-CoA 5-hydroxylase/oxidoreductase [Planctomycetota bacterium]